MELGIKELFAHVTLTALAAVIDRSVGKPTRRAVKPSCARRPAAACLFAQQRLWFLDQLEGGGAPTTCESPRVAGRFDVARAEQALNRIVERHEPLRTVFASEQGLLRQVIGTLWIVWSDRQGLRQLNETERERAVRVLAQADAQTPFDLSRDLMMQGSFLQLSDEDGCCCSICITRCPDGWSMGVLVQVRRAVRNGALRGGGDQIHLGSCRSAMPTTPSGNGSGSSGAVAGRTAELTGSSSRRSCPPCTACKAGPGASGATALQGARHNFAIDEATYEGLRQVAQAKQATLFMVLAWGR